jgi:hypothetical protein
VDLAQVVNAKRDPAMPERMSDDDFEALRSLLAAAGLQLRADEYGREKLRKLRSMYEPYVHATGQNLMLTLPAWKHSGKTRDNWQAGPWDRVIQARGLAGVKAKAPGQLGTVTGEDHF